jgi:hypothetical protein
MSGSPFASEHAWVKTAEVPLMQLTPAAAVIAIFVAILLVLVRAVFRAL